MTREELQRLYSECVSRAFRSYANGRPAPWHRAERWRGRPRITDETKAAMREARSAGSTLSEIAARFGCSVTHAHRIVGRKEV